MKKIKLLTIATIAPAIATIAPILASCGSNDTDYQLNAGTKQQTADLRKYKNFSFTFTLNKELGDGVTIYVTSTKMEGAVQITSVTNSVSGKSVEVVIQIATDEMAVSPGETNSFDLTFNFLKNEKILSTQTITGFSFIHSPEQPGDDNVALVSEKAQTTDYAQTTATFIFNIKDVYDGDNISATIIRKKSGANIEVVKCLKDGHRLEVTTSIDASLYQEASSEFDISISCTGKDTWSKIFSSLSVTYNHAVEAIPTKYFTIEGTKLTKFSYDTTTELQYCNKLVIPKEVTEIGEGVFSEAFKTDGALSNIKSIEFESGSQLTKIGKEAFYKCNAITNSLYIPSTVTSIGYAAFARSKINSITFIDNSETNAELTIEDGAFAYTNISGSLVLPSRLVEAKYGAFAGSSNLRSLAIKNQETKLGDCAFSECNNIQYLDLSAFNDEEIIKKLAGTYWTKCDKTSQTTYGTFYGWGHNSSGYFSITLSINPKLATSEQIGWITSAIRSCAEYEVGLKTDSTTTVNDFKYETDGADGCIITGINGTIATEKSVFCIPQYGTIDGTNYLPITQIKDNAFYDEENSKSLIPVTCQMLMFSSSSSLKIIGANNFRDATFTYQNYLTELSLPSSLEEIGERAFYNTKN